LLEDFPRVMDAANRLVDQHTTLIRFNDIKDVAGMGDDQSGLFSFLFLINFQYFVDRLADQNQVFQVNARFRFIK